MYRQFDRWPSIIRWLTLSLSLLVSRQAFGGEYLLDSVFGPTALYFVLNDAAVREELVVSDSQSVLLKRVLEEHHSAIAAAMRRAREMRMPGEAVDSKSEVLALNRTILPAIEQILTDEQFLRLQQVVYQKLIRRYEMKPLQYANVVKAIQLSNDDLVALDRIRKKEFTAWSGRASELREQHNKTIHGILTPEQHSRFNEIYGEPADAPVMGLSLTDRVDIEFRRRCPRLYLLCSDGIRDDVELIDDQYAEIKVMQDRFFDREEELGRERRDLPTGERSKYLAQKFDELAQSCIAEEEKILLPHQIRRLNQIVFQVQSLEKDLMIIPLMRESVAEALNLSDDQRKRLYAEYTDGEKRLSHELDIIWKQTLRTVIESLTPDQQARYHRLVGKPFE
jgi:hypothetical protein